MFIIDGKPYAIRIERCNFTDVQELVGKKVSEASFFRSDKEGNKAFSTSNETVIPVKIYGTVKNGLQDKLAELDALYFRADRHHSTNNREYRQKVSIYATLVGILQRGARFDIWYYEKKEPGEHYFCSVRRSFSNRVSFLTLYKRP